MAQTTAKKAKVPAPRSKPVAKKAEPKSAIAQTTELSEEVLKSVESAQRAAIEAVRKFVESVDEALPASRGGHRRETVIDAALEMADRLVTTQYDFLHNVVRDAGRALNERVAKKR